MMGFLQDTRPKSGRFLRSTTIGAQNYETKLRRYSFVAGSVFVSLVLLIAVTLILINYRETHNCVASQAVVNINQQLKSDMYTPSNDFAEHTPDVHTIMDGKLILLVDGKKLVSFDHKSQRLSLLYRASNISTIEAFDVHVGKYIYRSEEIIDENEEYIVVSKALNENEVDFVLEKMQFKPIDMMSDRKTGNLYAIDKDTGNLFVINLRAGYYAGVLMDLTEAREVALDPDEGIMFILHFSQLILRANMDGTDIREIVVNDNVSAITVDQSQKRLYWISNLINIKSTDYEGKQRRTVFIDNARINGLTILDGQLFWSWQDISDRTNLFSCKISMNYTCVNHSSYNLVGNVTSIRGYSSTDEITANPCELKHCQHLCLISGKNSSICRCSMGWQLNLDERSCDKVSNVDVLIS